MRLSRIRVPFLSRLLALFRKEMLEALRVLKASMGQQEQMERKALKATMEPKVSRESRVFRVHKG